MKIDKRKNKNVRLKNNIISENTNAQSFNKINSIIKNKYI